MIHLLSADSIAWYVPEKILDRWIYKQPPESSIGAVSHQSQTEYYGTLIEPSATGFIL